ncbi:MAG: response regulator [Herpetosiphon sp.]|nr:response regulator [Herpetosiphon sp.]
MTNPVRNPAIILVEDEPDILIILHRIMRDLTGGYDIITVNSAMDALSVLKERFCPLLITDHNMPGMTGTQLTQVVKTEYTDTKVIIITAYATPEVERTARTAGVDYFLTKPFSLDRLEQIIKEVLDQE